MLGLIKNQRVIEARQALRDSFSEIQIERIMEMIEAIVSFHYDHDPHPSEDID